MEVLDYTSRGIFFIASLVIFASITITISEIGSNKKKSENETGARIWALISSIFAISAMFIEGNYNYSTVLENKQMFDGGTYLECNSGFNNYLVSKDRGWQRKGEFLIKDDFIVNTLNCSISQVQK